MAFGSPPSGPFGEPPAAPTPVKLNDTTALAMALATALFCCMPGGVIALLVLQQAKSLAAKGDLAGAEAKLRTSTMISGISGTLGLIFICLYVALVAADPH